MPRPAQQPQLRRAALIGLALVAVVFACGREVTAPSNPVRHASGFSFSAQFPKVLEDAAGVAGEIVPFNRVRVVLHHPDATLALDTVVAFPAGADSVALSLNVPLLPGDPVTGETMTLDLAYVNAVGDTVFRGGPITVTVAPGQFGNAPVTVPVRYTGAGSNAVGVRITPHLTNATAGNTFSLTGVAVDGGGNAIANTPIVWSSLDPTIATIISAVAGTGTAQNQRGSARIVAQLLTGAADTAVVTVTLPASQIAVASGGGQTGAAGTQLAQPIVAKVTASDGVGVPGVPVTFAVGSGGGSVASSTATTDANGLAGTTWRLGPVAGAQTATASAGGLANSLATFTATATPAVPTKLVVSTQPASTTAGATISNVAFAAQDAGGNLVTSFTGPVSIALGANPAGATLGGTLTVNAVGGIATFSTLSINRAGTGYTLVASTTGLAGATTNAFDIAAAAAAKLVFTAQPTSAVDGAAIAPAVTVSAEDADGNLNASFTGAVQIVLGSNPSGATLSGTTTATAVAGVATFTNLAINRTAQGYTLTASAAGLASATSSPFDVGIGAPSVLFLASGGNQTGTTGSALAQPIIVGVTDVGGSPVSGVSIAFAVATGGGSLSAAAVVTDAQGHAAVNWTLGALVGAQSISATRTGLSGSPLTISATATAGTATQLAITQQPGNAAAGASIAPAIIITAKDANNNTVASFTGNVTLALGANPGGSTLSGSLTVAAVAGVATFNNISLNKAAVGYTLVASATGVSSATSAAFQITPAAASVLAFTVQPSTALQTVAMAPAIQVTARDAFGNTATAFTGTVTLGLATNPTGAVLSGTLATAAVAGVASFGNISLNLVGAGYALSASATGLTAATSTTFSITSNVPVEAWTNAAGGNWSTAANWSLGRVPVSTDSILITLAGTYTVTLDTTFTVQRRIILGAASGTQTLAVSNRTLTLTGPMSVLANGAFKPVGSTVAGTGTLTNAGSITLNASSVNAPLVNQGTLIASGTSALNGTVTTAVGSTLAVGQVDGCCGRATLTVATGFTNNGTIQITDFFAAAYSSQLVVASGTLTNAAGATLTSLPGTAAGGSRLLVATVANAGTISAAANAPLTATLVGASTNSGTIDASLAAISLTENSPATFVNTGTITVGATQTLTLAGNGSFTQSGTLTGGNLVLVNVGTATFNAAVSSTTVTASGSTLSLGAPLTTAGNWTVANSTIGGSNALTNAAGNTLTLNGSAVSVPLVNQGTLIASANSALSGAVTTTSTSLIQVGQVDGCCGQAVLTVASGFTNNGTIQLTDFFAASYGSQLIVASGTLTNAVGATIAALGGTSPGGSRTLAAQLNNQGTLTLGTGLSLSQSGAAHVNSGTINVSAGHLTLNQFGTNPSFTMNGGTLSIASGYQVMANNGTFTYAGGVVSGPGTLVFSNATLNLAASLSNATVPMTVTAMTINGPGTLTNATGQTLTINNTIVNAPVSNQGSLTASGNSALNGAVTTAVGSTLTVGQVDGCCGTATLTVATGFTNNGTIQITDFFAAAYSSQLVVASGTLTNAVGATITALPGTAPGGARTVAANLANAGTISAAAGAPLTVALSGASTNSGSVDASLANITLTQSNAAATFTNTGALTVGSAQTLVFNGGGGGFTHSGSLNGGAFALNGVGAGVFNAAIPNTAVTVTGSTVSLSTPITTAGAWTVASSTIGGGSALTNASGQSMILNNSTIAAPLVNQGSLVASGNSALSGAVTTAVGSSMSIGQVDGCCGQAALTVANGFTNNGTIQLTDFFAAAYSSLLSVTAGTLTNAAGATISALGGTAPGGGRSLAAELNNQGTLNVTVPLSLGRPGAAHQNSGAINVGANLTLNQSGPSPSFTNNGGTVSIANGYTVAVSNGTFAYVSGALIGPGTLALSNMTMNLTASLSNAALPITVSAVTVNGPGTFTNSTGQSLTLNNSSMNAPLVNQGVLTASGNSALNGSVTTSFGSTLAVGQVDGCCGTATLTVANGFTNTGTIQLSEFSPNAYSSQLIVSGGTLVNQEGATITALPGTAPGGSRTLVANLVNTGTVSAAAGAPLTVTLSGASANNATIDASAANITLTQSNAAATFTNTGALTVGPSQTLTFNGGGGGFTHSGSLNGGAFALNGVGAGAFNSVIANSPVTVRGSTVSLGAPLTTTGTWTVANSTINGAYPLTNGTGLTLTLNASTINTPLVNQGTLVASAVCAVNGVLTTVPGSLMQIGQVDGASSTASLTVANGFTNYGDLQLSEFSPNAYSATLTLSQGVLTNARGATLEALGGTAPGGARTINATLDNIGTLNLFTGAAGTLQLNGNLVLDTASVVNASIGGATAGSQYGQLQATAYVTLGGTINVGLVNAFTPTSGQSFSLITSGLFTSSTFSTLNLPPTMTPVYNSNNFQVHQP